MDNKLTDCWGNPLAVSQCNFQNTEWGTVVYSQRGVFLGKYETDSEAYENISEMVEDVRNGG